MLANYMRAHYDRPSSEGRVIFFPALREAIQSIQTGWREIFRFLWHLLEREENFPRCTIGSHKWIHKRLVFCLRHCCILNWTARIFVLQKWATYWNNDNVKTPYTLMHTQLYRYFSFYCHIHTKSGEVSH